MANKVALLDVDGVLLNIVPAVQKYIKEHYNTTISTENITCWDWEYCLGLPEGTISSTEFWEYVWHKEAVAYPMAQWFVSELKRYGYFVQAISHRAMWQAQAAAGRDFEQFEFDACIFTKDKSAFINEHYPAADFMLEDYPNNAVDIGTNTKVKSYLIDRPWNNGCISVTNAWTRVYGYDDILRAIKLGDTKAYFG